MAERRKRGTVRVSCMLFLTCSRLSCDFMSPAAVLRLAFVCPSMQKANILCISRFPLLFPRAVLAVSRTAPSEPPGLGKQKKKKKSDNKSIKRTNGLLLPRMWRHLIVFFFFVSPPSIHFCRCHLDYVTVLTIPLSMALEQKAEK